MIKKLLLVMFCVLLAKGAAAVPASTPASTPVSKSVSPSAPIVAPVAHTTEAVTVNLKNVLDTLVSFDAIDLKDNRVLDDYAKVAFCDDYKKLFQDDFGWQKKRVEIRNAIKAKSQTLPRNYNYNIKTYLDRYDFDKKKFMLMAASSLDGVNTVILINRGNRTMCGQAFVDVLPEIYRLQFKPTVFLAGLPMAEAEASSLVKRMLEAKNEKRMIYAIFDFTITYIEPMKKSDLGNSYVQGNNSAQEMAMDGTLKAIRFYEDDGYTRLIYTYVPKEGDRPSSDAAIMGL